VNGVRSRQAIDLMLIVGSAMVLTAILVYLLQLWDVISFTGRGSRISELPNQLYYHLRSSLLFFAADLVFFLLALRALSRALNGFLAGATGELGSAERKSRLATIYSLDSRTDITITVFFGIGVIYTAIGMESALLTALGGIHGAEDAARQGAWEILRRLVDGGLILALSTTICGGIGGYALRLMKHAVVGRRLTLLGVTQEGEIESLLLDTTRRLEAIQELMREGQARGPTRG
jgi:hypothetical protein